MNIRFIALLATLTVLTASGWATTTTVNVAFEPPVSNVVVGETFTLDLWVRSTPSSAFDNISIYLNYDRTKLQLLGAEPTANIGYLFRTIPVYSWSSSTPIYTDYQLPGLIFKALAPVQDTEVQLAGPGRDAYGNPIKVVRLGCDDVTGTVTNGHVQVLSSPPGPPVPEPITLVCGLIGLALTGGYIRKRTAA